MKGIVTALALTAALIVPSAPSALADGKTLVVGTNATFPPMQFVDKDKKITGYEMDLVRAVAKEAGYDITIKNAEFDGLISDVASGNCDLIAACMTITPERQKAVLFSDPVYSLKQACVVPSGSAIASMDDLAGKKVGAQLGTTGSFAVKKLAPKAQLRNYDDVGLAFQDMKNGNIDAVVCDDPVAAYYANHDADYANTLKLAFLTEEGERVGFAFRKGDTELVSKFNEALARVRANGTEQALLKQWKMGK